MAQPGSPHSFAPMEDLPSSISSVVAFKPEARHLRHFLIKTCQLTGLSHQQLPVPSLGEAGEFTLAESTILPLLCSMTHAMAATLKAVEELRLQTSDLDAHVPNSFPEGIDHSVYLNQFQSSLLDLSHRVAPLPPATMAPPHPQSSRPRPSAVPGPQAPPARGAPPYPSKGPTLSFAAIVGGTGKFDEAVCENMAARKNRGKKKSSDNTSATQVAEAVKKASPPKTTNPLACAAKRSFAPCPVPRTSPRPC